jgi:hypothetical protein
MSTLNNKHTDIIAKFTDRIKDARFMPVELTRLSSEAKKNIKFPNDWTNQTFDSFDMNSIAFKTGNGVIVIDIDTKEGEFVDNCLTIDTFTVETTNGYHLYFKTDEKFKNNTRIENLFDVRTDGGCAFIYTEDKHSSYEIMKDSELMELPKWIEDKLSRKKDALGYEYGEDGLKYNKEKREPNEALFEAVNSGNTKRIVPATGMSVDEINNYVGFNRFAFILANEPSIRNDDVIKILELVVENDLPYDWDSTITQKIVKQSLGNMVWASEYKEPENEDFYDLLFGDIDFTTAFREPIKAERIDETPFFRNVVNIVYAKSKLGKSRSIAETLFRAGFKGKEVIWLDRDYNIDSELGKILKQFTWVNDNVGAIEEQLLKVDGEGKIIVLDSLKDFIKGDGTLDSNDGAQKTMEYIRQFVQANFTVIIVAHATVNKVPLANGGIKEVAKIKGNEEVIRSKCDLIFQLHKVHNYREFRLEASRISDVDNLNFPVMDKEATGDRIRDTFYDVLKFGDAEDGVPVRDVREKIPSSLRKEFAELEDEVYRIEGEGKKNSPKMMFLIEENEEF